MSIFLVDVKSGSARPLGKPGDHGPPSWLPDGKGLLTVERKYPNMAKISVDTICTIDLNGQVTKLREGDQP